MAWKGNKDVNRENPTNIGSFSNSLDSHKDATNEKKKHRGK